MIKKNAISPVVATALLLVVAVVAVIGFQNWFGTYSSDLFVKTEKDSSQTSQTNIETLVGDQLYFKNTLNENVSIKQIKLGNRECNISLNVSSGVHNISLGDCVENLTLDSSLGDIIVITDKQIYTKKHLFKDVTINPNIGGSLGQVYNIFFVSPTPENNLTSSNTEYLINISVPRTNIANLTLNWNGSKQVYGDGWIKYFNPESNNAIGYSLIETNNNELLIAGYGNERYSTVWNSELFLIKTNLSGEVISINPYNGMNTNFINRVIQVNNNDFIVVGTQGTGGCTPNYGLIQRYNSSLSLLWSKYTIVRSYTAYFRALEASNGDLVTSGYAMDSGCGSGSGSAILSRFDSNGNEIWTMSLGDYRGDIFYGLIESNDSNYIAAGATSTYGGTDKDLILTKFDSSGNEIWTYVSNGNLNTGAISLLHYDNSSFYLAGYSQEFNGVDNNVFLSKFDYDGNILWTSYIEGSGGDTAKKLIKTNDNNIVLLSYSDSFGKGDYDVLLIKFDPNGNIIWSNLLDLSTADTGWDVIETSQGNLVVTGTALTTATQDVFLAQFNSQGELLGSSNYTKLNLVNSSGSLTFAAQSLSYTIQSISSSSQTMSSYSWNFANETLFQGITKNSTHSNLLINKSGLSVGYYEYNISGYDSLDNYLISEKRNLTIN